MPKRKMTLDPELAAEAKSIVALAFRNGPIEDVHAGKECPNCAGKVEYSHITQDEMKNIMKRAVDTVYKLLWLKQNDAEKYEARADLPTPLCEKIPAEGASGKAIRIHSRASQPFPHKKAERMGLSIVATHKISLKL